MQKKSSDRLWVSAALCWLAPQEILLQRRSMAALHGAGAWELAGGKVEHGESSQAALARELREEWGGAAEDLSILGIAEVLHHRYPEPGPEVHLLVFHVDGRCLAGGAWSTRLRAAPGVVLQPFKLGEIPLAQCLAADRDFLAGLAPFSF